MQARDLTGNRYGRLVAIRNTGEKKRTSFVWECQCDCGNIAYVPAGHLTNGGTQSCGCLHRETIQKDRRGQRFGRLLVLGDSGRRQHGSIVWECQCDCGTLAYVRSVSLIQGATRSCGCLQREVVGQHGKLPRGEAALRRIICEYKHGARDRNLTWELTDEQARQYFESPCHYCGALPHRSSQSTWKGKTQLNGGFLYNGIDRVDNIQGYNESNCVACCRTCNRAKDTMGAEEFKEWIRRAYTHLFG